MDVHFRKRKRLFWASPRPPKTLLRELRNREVGLRTALGARTAQIVGMLLRRNARALLSGVGVGLLLAVVASLGLQSEF